jgi:hypothetical protein
MVVQGRTPTNISIKWAKTATRRTEWGVRCWSWRPNSSKSRRKKEEIGETNPHIMYELKRTNSPTARSRKGILPALIFPANAGAVHPRRRHTEFSWAWLWKRHGKGSEDIAMDVEVAKDGSQGSREEKDAERKEAERKEADREEGCEGEGALRCLLMARAKR